MTQAERCWHAYGRTETHIKLMQRRWDAACRRLKGRKYDAERVRYRAVIQGRISSLERARRACLARYRELAS